VNAYPLSRIRFAKPRLAGTFWDSEGDDVMHLIARCQSESRRSLPQALRLPSAWLLAGLFFVGVLFAGNGLSGAWAEDEEPAAPTEDEAPPAPVAPKPDPKLPGYSIEYLMPSEILLPGDEDEPGPWKIVDIEKAGDGAASEGELVDMAENLELDDDVFYVETTGLEKGGQAVGVAMLDVDKNVHAFLANLSEKAGVRGWRVRELGSPARLLVVSGSAGLQAEAESALIAHVVYRLARMAMDRMNGRGALEDTARDVALAYRDAADRIAPGAGVGHVITGRDHFIRARLDQWKGKKDAKIDEKENKLAADFFEKALADGVPYPPRGSVLVFAAGELGGMLLVRKDKSVVPAAIRALEKAVEAEKDAMQQTQRFTNRYNLACAYAIEGDKDAALKALRQSLETMKSLKKDVARQSWENIEKDKDFDSIRSDPRFSKLIADYEPEKPAHWDRNKAEAEKRRREKEKGGKTDGPDDGDSDKEGGEAGEGK
jgi:tetratricopeptide (TPR) repeat protein